MTFDTFLTAGLQPSSERRKMPYGFSFALHGGLLALGILYSVCQVEEMTPPTPPPTLVTFVAPSGGPPPAPAPAQRRAPRVRPRPAALVQPRPQVAPAIEPPASEISGPETSDPPVGPPGDGSGGDGEVGPEPGGSGQFVSPTVARGQLAIDPQAEPYRVKLPPILASARMSLWALVRICVDREGRVTSVKILKGADPALDPTIVAVLSTWRYRPYTLNGRPVPFCSNVRYEISVS